MLVKPDRAGRPSLSIADARGLTTGEVRRLLEHNRAAGTASARHETMGRRTERGIAEAARAVQARAGTRRSGSVSRRPGMPPSKPDGSTRSISELGDLVEAHGRDAAIRIAVGKVEQRDRGRHLVEARRRLVGYYESTP